MALNRQDTISYMAKAGAFTSALVRYNATYAGKTNTIAITVLNTDLPGNATPSDAQVLAVADPKATLAYNNWKLALDRMGATATPHSGHAGTIVA